jgi:hypothetical protein
MVRSSRVRRRRRRVNEDIYDVDPEFGYLALSLTVKNRKEWAYTGVGEKDVVGGEKERRLWLTDTFVNTAAVTTTGWKP